MSLTVTDHKTILEFFYIQYETYSPLTMKIQAEQFLDHYLCRHIIHKKICIHEDIYDDEHDVITIT